MRMTEYPIKYIPTGVTVYWKNLYSCVTDTHVAFIHKNTACTQYDVRRNSLAVYELQAHASSRTSFTLSHSYTRIYLQRALLRN